MDAMNDRLNTYGLTTDQTAMQDMVRAFSDTNIAPHAVAWDQEKHFPLDVIKQTAELGMGGIYCREEHGGSGLTRLDAAVIFEAMATGCPATSAFISIHNMVAWMIDTFGDDDQRARVLPALMSMEKIASYCLTEPGSGSDAAAMKTTAKPSGNGYVLNGVKQFISGAGSNDLYVVMARTEDAQGNHQGVSAFIVEDGSEGLSFGAQEAKMGWHVQPTAQVILDDCFVPLENRINAEGMGFKMAMAGLDGGRLNIAACSLGGAQAAFDRAQAYSTERKAFGQEIGRFQAIQFKLADMATDLEAARLMLYSAAAALDAKAYDASKRCAMAKRFVTDTCFNVANEALQIHGGYGYLADYGVEKIVRDLRVHQILEGTNEIMRVIIARALEKSA
ncbi:MAG: acyl-CoA dehydrogenase family protein [Pseudomonadota bacterium]